MKTFFFLAGLPRSGSTVLASILNQNPNVYVTPTSPLLDLLFLNEQEWHKNPSVIANKFPEQLVNMSEAIINSTWQHIEKPIIIDKHRAWGRNLPAISQIFKIKPKLIITVRDISSIVASFIRLLNETSQSPHYIDKILLSRNLPTTHENRCKLLWQDFIHDTWDSLKTAYNYDKSSLLLVDYDDLVSSKQSTIESIYNFLELPQFSHDFENIKSETVDDDLLAWGIENLHTIRPSLSKTAKHPKEILGERIYNNFKLANLEFWRNK
jgi:sulfotransferase